MKQCTILPLYLNRGPPGNFLPGPVLLEIKCGSSQLPISSASRSIPLLIDELSSFPVTITTTHTGYPNKLVNPSTVKCLSFFPIYLYATHPRSYIFSPQYDHHLFGKCYNQPHLNQYIVVCELYGCKISFLTWLRHSQSLHLRPCP